MANSAVCTHPRLVCGDTTATGTPATCGVCGARVWIPPVRVGKTKTIPGLGLSARARLDMELGMGHAAALAAEGRWGARE